MYERPSASRRRAPRAEAAKNAAEESGNALKAQLDQACLDNEVAIQKVKEEAEANATSDSVMVPTAL